MTALIKKIIKNKLILVINLILLIITIYALSKVWLLANLAFLFKLLITLVLVVIWLVIMLINTIYGLQKDHKKLISLTVTIIYTILLLVATIHIHNIIRYFNNLNYTTYTTSLVALSTNEHHTLNDLSDSKIGILSDEDDIQGYSLPMEIIKNKKLSNATDEYKDYVSILKALYNGEIEYAFLPTNYVTMFSDLTGFEKLKAETSIIYTQSKRVKTKTIATDNVDHTFTFLIMGIDSLDDNIEDATFKTDALILMSFNYNTFNTTILNIPTDTYMPITCFSDQRQNKVAHASWYGDECVTDTISHYIDLPVNYYLKLNNQGLIDLVNALGGIEVVVPYDFCEVDTQHNTITLKAGETTLNGEQALALAHNKQVQTTLCDVDYTINDQVIANNKQLIIEAIIDKVASINNTERLNEVLNSINNNVKTNLNSKQVLTLYERMKKIKATDLKVNLSDLLSIQPLTLNGYSATIYDYDQYNGEGTKLALTNYIPYQNSLKEVKEVMKLNLGLEDTTDIKTFQFNLNDTYETAVIGNQVDTTKLALLDNLIGKTEKEVKAYASDHQLTINIEYVSATKETQLVGTVISQSVPNNTDLTYVKNITVNIVNKAYGNETSQTNALCSIESNKDLEACQWPNFTDGQTTISYVKQWFSNRAYIKVSYQMIATTDDDYDIKQAGLVTKQSTTTGSIYDYVVSNQTFVITYMEKDSN